MYINLSPIGEMPDAFVLGAGEFDSVAVDKVVVFPAFFLSLHSIFQEGRRCPPAFPLLTNVVSLIWFLT